MVSGGRLLLLELERLTHHGNPQTLGSQHGALTPCPRRPIRARQQPRVAHLASCSPVTCLSVSRARGRCQISCGDAEDGGAFGSAGATRGRLNVARLSAERCLHERISSIVFRLLQARGGPTSRRAFETTQICAGCEALYGNPQGCTRTVLKYTQGWRERLLDSFADGKSALRRLADCRPACLACPSPP